MQKPKFLWRDDFFLRCFKFQIKCKKGKTAFLCANHSVKGTYSQSVLAFLCIEWPWSAMRHPSIHPQRCSPTDYCGDDDDEKALRSRSAARPGEMAPLVTLSSRWGRASLTLGWFWKWQRAFSWIKLHIQTFCWALRRPCSSPLASMASRYDSILAQASGMPSLVCEEARTTWRGGEGDACVNLKSLFFNHQVVTWYRVCFFPIFVCCRVGPTSATTTHLH